MAEKYQAHRGLYDLMKAMPQAQGNTTVDWLGGIFSAAEEGRPIVYNQFTLFSELMVAMDIQPLCPELWSVMSLSADKNACCEGIDAAQEAGISPELCSANKTMIGDIMLEKMPPPSMVVLPTFPCDNSKIGYQVIAHLTGAPIYYLDCPYWMDEAEAMDYWVNQYKGLISFLEEHSGKKLDYDRLKEVVEESNRYIDLWLEGTELLKMKPLPQNGPFGSVFGAGLTSMGNPAATTSVKDSLDALKARIDKGETAVPEEKVRVIWFYYPVFWDGGLTRWMATEMGAVVPTGLIGYYPVEPIDTSTPESTIRGLARRSLEAPMGRQGRGPADIWIEDCLYAYDGWQGDCIILASNPGCKWLRGMYGLFRDICRDRGIPNLIWEVDFLDPRITSEDESRTRIEQFLDTVMER